MLDVSTVEGVSLRLRTPADRAFLFDVYASTRHEELASTGWSREQIDRFLAFQADAQDQHYTRNYTSCRFYVIEHEGTAVGRLYLDTWPSEVRIVDISLLPAHRGLGLGTKILRAIIAYATAERLPVSIHVEQANPARRLYERLAFHIIEERGAHFLMKRSLEG